MNAIVVHYKELALKGRNRPWFVQQLVRNLRTAVGGLDVRAVRSVMGRIEIELPAAAVWRTETSGRPPRNGGLGALGAARSDDWRGGRRGRRRRRSGRSCAIGSATCSASRTSRTRDARPMSSRRWHRPSWPTSATREAPSFRVSARRADKQLPFTSPQIEREVGGLIKEAKGWHVSLDDPALTIHVEMMPDHAFYYFGKEPGRRRSADRHGRPRRLPAVGRHRLAGGRLSDDAARLLRPASSTFTATRFCRAPRRKKSARSRRSSRDISFDRVCIWCRSASCSSRSCSRCSPSCGSWSIGA